MARGDGEYGHGIATKHARAQGVQARQLTDDDSNNERFFPQDNPYGPGELADAWSAGFGSGKEEVEQVDTSEPTTDDVRREPAKQVRKGSGGARRGRGNDKPSKGKSRKTPTKASTTTTGTAETALETHRTVAEPSEAGQPNLDSTLGDPRGTDGDRTQIDPDKLM